MGDVTNFPAWASRVAILLIVAGAIAYQQWQIAKLQDGRLYFTAAQRSDSKLSGVEYSVPCQTWADGTTTQWDMYRAEAWQITEMESRCYERT